MRFQGRITSWNDAKGIGTITWNGGSDRVFVHISAFTTRRKRPAEGDIVTYEVQRDSKGKFRATKVAFPASQLAGIPAPRRSGGSGFIATVLALFSLHLAFSVLTGKVELWVAMLYLMASAVAFVAYSIDKSAARRGDWRTQESTLHLIALLCGWPGAFLAQKALRHKTAKSSFQSAFVAMVALNLIGFFIYVYPAYARAALLQVGLWLR